MASRRTTRRDDSYDREEVAIHRAELQRIERERMTPAIRREIASDVLSYLKDPETVAERIGWLLDGTYGRGAQLEALKVLANRRMNRAAILTQTVAILDQRAPHRIVVNAWKKLLPSEQAALHKTAVREIARHEGASSRDPRPRRRSGTRPYRRCERGLEVQTLILPKERYDPSRARAWARKHGFRSTKIDETGPSFRLRQRNPKEFVRDSFRTITMGEGNVRAVVGCPLPGRESDRERRGSARGRRDPGCGCSHGGRP